MFSFIKSLKPDKDISCEMFHCNFCRFDASANLSAEIMKKVMWVPL